MWAAVATRLAAIISSRESIAQHAIAYFELIQTVRVQEVARIVHAASYHRMSPNLPMAPYWITSREVTRSH